MTAHHVQHFALFGPPGPPHPTSNQPVNQQCSPSNPYSPTSESPKTLFTNEQTNTILYIIIRYHSFLHNMFHPCKKNIFYSIRKFIKLTKLYHTKCNYISSCYVNFWMIITRNNNLPKLNNNFVLLHQLRLSYEVYWVYEYHVVFNLQVLLTRI